MMVHVSIHAAMHACHVPTVAHLRGDLAIPPSQRKSSMTIEKNREK